MSPAAWPTSTLTAPGYRSPPRRGFRGASRRFSGRRGKAARSAATAAAAAATAEVTAIIIIAVAEAKIACIRRRHSLEKRGDDAPPLFLRYRRPQ